MKYSGIDLHANNSVVSVTDEEDRVLAEKRLPNDLAKIVGFLMPWREALAGGGGGIDVQLILVGRWPASGRLQGAFSQHQRDQEVRRTQA